mmetsp:Transcript_17251/g.29805  ORF Transcript_17251/g.29805 Transcript_17251/m.29805 type:complete len:257 (-) Transcript_17251:487-1257(-)|eukprot:CAMPEP_0196659654 /NCGR_PEP_ID=MMETSP1086-20130531/36076_1 /TAXON_ID=77921 /ORGANISM="Cyanoptyche  gloeocystis , Strain SAG4.97" /LENGTH=256 /DNA_ID=CAMNT_0041993721 /DNA_START=46 /DNA_END=816 /DNA_ORIENTATION=+
MPADLGFTSAVRTAQVAQQWSVVDVVRVCKPPKKQILGVCSLFPSSDKARSVAASRFEGVSSPIFECLAKGFQPDAPNAASKKVVSGPKAVPVNSIVDVTAFTKSKSGRSHNSSGAGSVTLETTDQAEWTSNLKQYLKNHGRNVARMAWKGYQKSLETVSPMSNKTNAGAKGAIFANQGLTLRMESPEDVGSVPGFFISREKLIAMQPDNQDVQELTLILERIDKYNPTTQFVLVFTDSGLTGVDIVTPSIQPPFC